MEVCSFLQGRKAERPAVVAGLSRSGEAFSLTDHRPHPGNLPISLNCSQVPRAVNRLFLISSQLVLKKFLVLSPGAAKVRNVWPIKWSSVGSILRNAAVRSGSIGMIALN